MTTLVATYLLAGAALGQRFKALILVPAITLAVLAAIGIGIASGASAWLIFLAAIASTISLQIGYLAGIALQQPAIVARARRNCTGGPVASLQPRGPAS